VDAALDEAEVAQAIWDVITMRLLANVPAALAKPANLTDNPQAAEEHDAGGSKTRV